MHLPEVTFAERALLGSMAAHADRDGKNAYASYETYARILGCSPRYVKGMVARLASFGYIVKGDWHYWTPRKRTRVWHINVAVRDALLAPSKVNPSSPNHPELLLR
jgi:hypothetical protein